MKKQLATTALCLTLAACSSTGPVHKTAAVAAPVQPVASSTVNQTQNNELTAAQLKAQRMHRLLATLSDKSVYFDFDKYNLKPQYESVVKQNADFMQEFAKDTVVLQGNTDDRGSKEYNLALGQKRADTVRQALVLMGVSPSRIEAISFGAEKPRATCQAERCWSQNRRVDFVHSLIK